MRLKLMPDYRCSPLWWDNDPERVGDIHPESLNLPRELCNDLWDWAARFDATLNQDDPAASGFASPAEHKAFVQDGRALAGRVGQALGVNANIRYAPPEA